MKNKGNDFLKLAGVAMIVAGMVMLPRGISAGEDRMLEWERLADRMARRFGLSPKLVKAIIWVESRGNPNASRKENSYYSYGLMGITYPTAVDMGYNGNPSGLFDPETNVFYGCKYLRWLAERPHINWDIEKIIAGYNAGPDLSPWPSAYVEKVKKYMKMFA